MGRKKKYNKVKKEQVLLCWSFPHHGWYKLNVDGSYRSGSGCIAGGGVIRNQEENGYLGLLQIWGTGKVIEAELWALYRGLELAWKSGSAPLEVETDSTTVLKLMHNPVEDISRVAQPRFLPPSVIEYRKIKKLEEVDIHMENLASVIFTWKVDNFSKLDAVKYYSDVFVIGANPYVSKGEQCRLLVGSSTLPLGWARHARFSLTIVNQLQSSESLTKDTEHVFNKSDSNSGFTSLIPLSEFCDHSKGYVVNDTCIIEAKVAVHKSEIKILEEQKTRRSTTSRDLQI
ncbi:ubiquitin-specific protease 12 [Prunus dulcis]|uniref:Ubiquitin-specific protease 12 n=1 Tax=Prunus dulcis TaxID=3755 RepID=A0A4Y1RDK9_PRUDU|nr:ubiquitin-specific protease 12 [Prunus dulcis]